jgi:hypothetical protein
MASEPIQSLNRLVMTKMFLLSLAVFYRRPSSVSRWKYAKKLM